MPNLLYAGCARCRGRNASSASWPEPCTLQGIVVASWDGMRVSSVAPRLGCYRGNLAIARRARSSRRAPIDMSNNVICNWLFPRPGARVLTTETTETVGRRDWAMPAPAAQSWSTKSQTRGIYDRRYQRQSFGPNREVR
jgi:hypothetical protein